MELSLKLEDETPLLVIFLNFVDLVFIGMKNRTLFLMSHWIYSILLESFVLLANTLKK